MLMTPEQNIKKHINSPNLMMPNKISKPLSWYNKEREAGSLVLSGVEPPQIHLTREDGPASHRLQNAIGYINAGDESGSPRIENEITESENVDEPDMGGIEEGYLGNKVDEMHPGRGRIRNSSQVFPMKDIVVKHQLSASMNNTEDLRKVLAKARVTAGDFNSMRSSQIESTTV